MDLIWNIFSYVCGQTPDRSFHIAGEILPVCQRCTGLYIGMAMTYLLVFLNGSYRRGLPPRAILIANIACILIMPPFGYHLIDPGPQWRFWTGLIYGNALATLFTTAGFSLIRERETFTSHWSDKQSYHFWILLLLINLLPFIFPIQTKWCYTIATICITMGFFITITIITLVAGSLLWHLTQQLPFIATSKSK